MTEEEIDLALLRNITNTWKKVARVVGATMMEIDAEQRIGRNDLYFANRISVLAKKGLIEHKGDLRRIRHCEIRLRS
jgi:hypothetical protein